MFSRAPASALALAAIGGSGRRGWKSWVRTLAPRSLLTGLRAPAKDRTPAA